MEKCKGTVIRRTPLTESSLIVTWCTGEHGILRTVAKGARRPKSPFAGKLDLFFEAEFEIIRSKKSDLHTLRELSLTSSRSRLRNSYLQTLAATYFIQLLNQVTEPETPIRKLNNLLNRALDHLEEKLPDMKTILHYEKQMTQALGILEPGQTPAKTLHNVYHRLPKTRAGLLQLIGK
ncbi:MAG: DNA repair protein RecO [Verrucomicrobiales bacterium]